MRNSEFFKAALKKEWREGQTRTISMPTDDFETMMTYLRFVYGIQLPDEFDFRQLSGIPTADQVQGCQAAYSSFAKLYILGGRLMDNTFKRAAATKIFDLFHGCSSSVCLCGPFTPGPTCVNTIYDETLESDPARRLMVDMHMKHLQHLDSEYNPRFVLDLARGFSETLRRETAPGLRVLELRDYLS